MRVFTFFLPTDTFKKKLELCHFFIHLAAKLPTYVKMYVNVSQDNREQLHWMDLQVCGVGMSVR